MFVGLKLCLLASKHITTHYGQATQFVSSGHRSCVTFFFVHMNSSLCGMCTWMSEFHTCSFFLFVYEYLRILLCLTAYISDKAFILVNTPLPHPPADVSLHLSLCFLLIPSSLFPSFSLFLPPPPPFLVLHPPPW